jgi:nitroimidazol reductase NimA-like FMN-containing flavoprotein (pyridoxamine 5'-phosphate oxidase superfamily)
MIDRSAVDRVLAAYRYLVLGTAGEDGEPWVSPVFFWPLDPDRVCWASSPDSRHSRNISQRARIAITVFDSTVDVGRSEAAYLEADAAQATPEEIAAALQSLNARLPPDKRIRSGELQPRRTVRPVPGRRAAPPLSPRPRRQPRVRKRR